MLLAGITGFQAALAAGAPWGRLAWGGGRAGTLPSDLRAASGAAALVWGAATVAVALEVPRSVRGQRRLLHAIGVVGAVGAAANLASPSPGERAVWTPVSAALAVLAWRAARGPAVSGASADRAA